MRLVKTVAELRGLTAKFRRDGKTVGFVPTMGFLHIGHLTLVARAKAENDVTVVSIFVNPLQFGANEDLARYPRDLARDSALLEEAGVDILFAPEVTEMYPRPMQTVVDVPPGSLVDDGPVTSTVRSQLPWRRHEARRTPVSTQWLQAQRPQ